MEYEARKVPTGEGTNLLSVVSMKTSYVIDCIEPYDKIRARVEWESCVFSIPIDFCIEFWNSTFPLVFEFTRVGVSKPGCITVEV